MNLRSTINSALSKILGTSINIESILPVGGGSINETFKIITSSGIYFVKKNSNSSFPEMFEKEALGIEVLKKANEIDLPNVILDVVEGDDAFLVLDFIESGNPDVNFWVEFGKKLALLHTHTANNFGLDHDNYIGSLVQKNNFHKDWSSFFINQRIQPQLKMAKDNGFVSSSLNARFERFFNKIDEIFPNEPPALLHGDLWSGNFMTSSNGEPVIIDPAVYYGHREMDIAMSKLFGGFNHHFYQSYNNTNPLDKGWESRLKYCNLYPLLVHVNLFGSSYLSQVEQVMINH